MGYGVNRSATYRVNLHSELSVQELWGDTGNDLIGLREALLPMQET